MSSEFRKVKLKDIASFKYGKTIRKQDIQSSGEYPVFSGYQVVGYLPNYMYKEEQLIIVCRGAGGTGDIKMSPGLCSITNLAIIISCDDTVIDKGYLYWRLIFSDTYSLRTGSAQPQITINTLESFEIEIEPDLRKQKEIAFTLSNINNKIRKNADINQTLEHMAQALFKSWFVDFEPVRTKIAVLEAGGSQEDATRAAMTAISGKDADALVIFERGHPEQYAELKATAEQFPFAVQDSELGEIPEGWSIKSLDTIATYQNGLALQKFRPENESNFLPVVKIAQLKKGFSDGEEKASPNIKPECIIDNGDVVFSWSGSLMVDIWCGGKAALNQHLFKVSSTKFPKWLYFKYTTHHLNEFQRIAEAKAVTMGHIKREHLSQAKCVIPASDTINSFTVFFEPLINMVISNRLECQQLEKIRDILLPKLLSGEITLPEAEQAVSEAENV
ncbi:TPA: restriction endonuclease subunit S [Serratia marcescens]|uniref:restriction endonuclease subunit S n=1 Tax=Serratia TaxID=613 RepID=UPI0018D39062|nr:restriction endonuclease subunit S [Serratia marcescens]MBH1896306.1 restriction endonuclease subunit S [Serratia marcescens]MBH2691530.1 restriction endonuclease subunit S [Serratia marcescens]MBH2740205.1 restriction endonuclease subunit S [Serratia marcescens]MBH2828371.1 restriction endonuclease subunit S [Serratia marcescens]MBH3225125.1 restriction endonuclease subunit S [Serratia marcescens]